MLDIADVRRAASDAFVAVEQTAIQAWRQQQKRDAFIWSGLALSGGGIRSATFCLGVLQALARNDLLKGFDYLSTVSGGGFIGTSLQWWWSGKANQIDGNKRSRVMQWVERWLGKGDLPRETENATPEFDFGTGPADFPYGTEHPDPVARTRNDPPDSEAQRKVLEFLRSHGNYLAPGDGINIWSGVGVVLRTILLNLIVWIPLAAFTFYLLSAPWPQDWAVWILSCFPNNGLPLPEGVILASWADTSPEQFGLRDVHSLPAVFAVMIWIAYAFVALFVFGAIAYSFQTARTSEGGQVGWKRGHTAWTIATLAVLVAQYKTFNLTSLHPILLAVYATVAMGCISILLKMLIIPLGVANMGSAYLLRRFFERTAGWFFRPVLLLLMVGLVPVAFKLTFTSAHAPGVLGILSVGAGVAAALWGHFQSLQKLAPGLASKILLPVGASLFLFGVVVLGYEFAMILKDPDIITAHADKDKLIVYGTLSASARSFIEVAIWTSILIGLVSAAVVNTNQIGLNRFYRDRLTEAYLPSVSAIVSGRTERSSVADLMPLHEAWNESAKGPYSLINTNVVLVNDNDPKYRLRGGDNYVLSPLYCGSAATGWFPTDAKASHLISLPSAMATSGAAANPNAGYIGTGPTRNRLLSIVMMLLSVRLGYWTVNPNPEILQRIRMIRPRHFFPGAAYALSRRGWKSRSKYLELTDGGHFDNLGVYELVRRKCGLIVVCDGEADEKTAYRALVSVQRRIEEDFKATIKLTEGAGPELLVANNSMPYPSGALMAKQPYFLAKVIYEDGAEAPIIYMKATMIDDLSFKVKGYKGSNLAFPHETTSDQFFDPEQFEAYRELGYRSCMQMLSKTDLKQMLNVHLTNRGKAGTKPSKAKSKTAAKAKAGGKSKRRSE